MKRVHVLLALVAGLLLIGSGVPAQAQAPSQDTLVLAAPEPLNNDPHIAQGASSVRMYLNLYEGLVRFEYGGLKLEPALAQRWTISPDGKTYTFTLRPDVKFHNGSVLTPADVKYSFERGKAKGQAAASYLEFFKEARVVDDHTIQIELTKPTAPFLMMLPRMFIIGQSCLAGKDSGGDMGTAYLQQNSCGTGPYKIESWERGRQIVLMRFNDYWRGWSGRHVNRVVIRTVPELATARLLLERGDIDVQHYVSLDDIPIVSRNPQIRIEDHEGIPATSIRFVTQKGATQNPKVREALTYSVPYDQFIENVMKGRATRLQGPIARGIACHDDTLPVYKQDLNRAKQLFAEAGYPNGLKLRMDNFNMYPERRQLALMWQADLKKIGVELEYKEHDMGTTYALLRDREKGPDTYMMGDYVTYPDPDAYMWRSYHSSQTGEGGLNYGFYNNQEFDRLIEEGRTTLDEAKRCDHYRRAQRNLVNNFVGAWLMQQHTTIFMRSRVKNYKPLPSAFEAYSFYEMYKEER